MKVNLAKGRADNTPPPAARRTFEHQLHRMVAQHESWTSVIGWILFNEGWGEWGRAGTARIADSVRRQDPSRLVDAHSGVNCCSSRGDSGHGDVLDWHAYPGPHDARARGRAGGDRRRARRLRTAGARPPVVLRRGPPTGWRTARTS